MTQLCAERVLLGGTALLERAAAYTLGSLRLINVPALDRPTPCAGWTLRTLLNHMDDSLDVLNETMRNRRIVTRPDPRPTGGIELVEALRRKACRMLGEWTNNVDDEPVRIGRHRLSPGLIAFTGALEIAVHGWDVAAACGLNRPIPEALAEELLEGAPLFVSPADRPARFLDALPVSGIAPANERLLAFLGRRL